jgi:hypothetical protein
MTHSIDIANPDLVIMMYAGVGVMPLFPIKEKVDSSTTAKMVVMPV